MLSLIAKTVTEMVLCGFPLGGYSSDFGPFHIGLFIHSIFQMFLLFVVVVDLAQVVVTISLWVLWPHNVLFFLVH